MISCYYFSYFVYYNMEQWKIIEEAPKYSISTLGRIKTNKTGRIRSIKCPSKLYTYVNLYVSKNKMKSFRVHRLVAKAFIPNPNKYEYVNHIDGIKKNNEVSNLEWCTASYNTLHAFKSGLMKNHSIFDEEAKKSIAYLHIKGYASQRDLAKALNVSYETIRQACLKYRNEIILSN
jgi:hypothetical protein